MCVNASGCTEKSPLAGFEEGRCYIVRGAFGKGHGKKQPGSLQELGAALTSSQQEKGPQSYSFKEMNSTNDLRRPGVDFSSAEPLVRPSLNQQLDFHLVKMLRAGPH